MDNPWEVTAEALAVMQELTTEAGDEKLGKMLRRYEKIRIYQMPKDSRNALQEQIFASGYSAGRKIREAASVYPDRDFGRKQNEYMHELMEKRNEEKKNWKQRMFRL